MKILMIGWGFPPKIQGGLDIHVHEICKELAKRNEVFLTLPEFNSPGKNVDGIRIIPIKCDSKTLVKSVTEYNRNIFRRCKNLRFNVIHSHDWFGVEASEWLRKKTKSPWVFTLHSLEYMRSCGLGKKSVMEMLERKAAVSCDRIVTVSRFMKREIAGKYGINPRKIDVVYNSATMGNGEPEKIRRRFGLKGRPVVLFIGRLSQQKGVEHVIYSAKMVIEKIPEARFLVVGEGHLKESLKRFSDHLGLGGKVFFPGFIPERDLASYYSAADVFVSPSFFEPFGITAVESLLAGTPAIVSANSGVLEKIPFDCILKVKPGNSRELADKIVHALESGIKVSERDKEILKTAYSWEKSAGEVEKIYQRLV